MTSITPLISDTELYALIIRKEKDGFDYLYDKYCGLLYGLILQSLCLKKYSDEIIELTFINICNAIHLYPGQQMKLNIWIISVLIQTIKDYLDSKSMNYTFVSGNFPLFIFRLKEEESVSLANSSNTGAVMIGV